MEDVIHLMVDDLFDCIRAVAGTSGIALFLRRSSSAAVKNCLKLSNVCSSSGFFLHSLQSSVNNPVLPMIS